ncbi:hypothetical protein [Mycobacterium sp. 852014-50255_SCH5639931]|uniref:hypothetical protein n=1 Tax=Mycobacterium sp. 852014-50255_SCH5639931 TaxID=1834112 RepID=UPI0012E8422E|nr:hypothetical protein [Mycobacterium sp. 852014-50255_SCH5639931]
MTHDEHDGDQHDDALDGAADHDRRRRCRHSAPKMIDRVQGVRGGEPDHRRGERTVRGTRKPIIRHRFSQSTSTTHGSKRWE